MATVPRTEDLAPLSMKEIIARLKGILHFSREERQKKDLLLEKVVKFAPPEQVEFLHNAALQKSSTWQPVCQKRKQEVIFQPRRIAQCVTTMSNSGSYLVTPVASQLCSSTPVALVQICLC